MERWHYRLSAVMCDSYSKEFFKKFPEITIRNLRYPNVFDPNQVLTVLAQGFSIFRLSKMFTSSNN